MIYHLGLTDFLPLLNTLSTNQIVVKVPDKLLFIDSITDEKIGSFNEELSDKLAFRQIAIAGGVKRHINLSDHLTLIDHIHRIYEPIIVDHLHFIQNSDRSLYFKNVITFTEILNYDYGRLVSDRLFLTQLLTVNHKWSNILFSDSLIFNSHASGYIIPLIGGQPSTPLPTPGGDTGGFLGPGGASSSPRPWDFVYTPNLSVLQQDVVIFISSIGPIYDLTLRNPSFSNQFKYFFNVIKEETRGRDLLINGNSSYTFKQNIQSFSYTIDYLTQLDGMNLINFLNQNLGTLVQITDYENIVWATILITNPEIIMTQKDKNNFSVSFEFEYVSNP